MNGRLLRDRQPGQHARVTSLELFFDLVFVFAVTQISHSLLADLTVMGALKTALLIMTVWWAWIYTAWITNWLDPEHPAVRAMLFVLMGVGLVLSTSLGDAFDGRALPFAAAYVTFQVGRSAFMLWACRTDRVLYRNFQRVIAWLIVSGVIWIAGAFVEGDARLAVWAVALGLEYLSVALAFWIPGLGGTDTHDWTVEGGHMAERCGLFIIICLGESVLVTGATFATLSWAWEVMASFAAAFVGTIAMWWIYFSAHADAAREQIEASDNPGQIARQAYTYAHIPVVAGIIVAAAGDELVLAHPGGHVATAPAWVVVGGPAVFLAGSLWFKHSVFGVFAPARVTGLALLVAAGLASPWLTPLSLSAAVAGVLVLVSAWETWIRLRQAPHPSSSGEGRVAPATGVGDSRQG